MAALTLRVSALEDRLLLLVQEMEDRWDLRAAAGEWRSLHLRGDESPDGEEIGSLMRLFRQFPERHVAFSAYVRSGFGHSADK